MKKILLTLACFSLLVVGAIVLADSTSTATTSVITADATCMKNAIEKRDTTIISSFDIYQASVKSALEARKTALKAAWDLNDKAQRKAAIKAAWKNYRDSVKLARSTLNAAKKAAWKQYVVDRKACKSVGMEDSTGSGVDAIL